MAETHITTAIKNLIKAAGEKGVTTEEAYHHISKEFRGQGCNRQNVSKTLYVLCTKTSKTYPLPFAEKVTSTQPFRYRLRGSAPPAAQSPLLTPKEHPNPLDITFWRERHNAFQIKSAALR